MPRSRSTPASAGAPVDPRNALEALLADPAGDPLRRAQWLDALDHQLRPFLPPPLGAHARLANLRDGRLVFVVDGPQWHARLRMAIPQLLDAARSIGLPVQEVRIRMATRSWTAALPRPSPAIPASATAHIALAEALALLRPADPPGDPGKSGET